MNHWKTWPRNVPQSSSARGNPHKSIQKSRKKKKRQAQTSPFSSSWKMLSSIKDEITETSPSCRALGHTHPASASAPGRGPGSGSTGFSWMAFAAHGQLVIPPSSSGEWLRLSWVLLSCNDGLCFHSTLFHSPTDTGRKKTVSPIPQGLEEEWTIWELSWRSPGHAGGLLPCCLRPGAAPPD